MAIHTGKLEDNRTVHRISTGIVQYLRARNVSVLSSARMKGEGRAFLRIQTDGLTDRSCGLEWCTQPTCGNRKLGKEAPCLAPQALTPTGRQKGRKPIDVFYTDSLGQGGEAPEEKR